MLTANILDLILENEDSMVKEIKYSEPVSKSDHLTMDWSFNCCKPHPSTRVVKYEGDYVAMSKKLGITVKCYLEQ